MLKVERVPTHLSWFRFDASESKDINGGSCTRFIYGFDDGTPPILLESPILSRPCSGVCTATLIVADKLGHLAKTQKEFDTKKLISSSSSSKNNKQSLHKQECVSPNKKGKKKHNTYNPPSSFKAIGNINIDRSFTGEIIPSIVDVTCIKRLFKSYMDKLTALQWDEPDEEKYEIGDIKVLDFDFHHKETGELLYCLITRQDESLPNSKNYKWNMDRKLYNKSQLQSMNISKIPQLSLFRKKRGMCVKMDEKINNRIAGIKLNDIESMIYNKQNIKKDNEIVWPLRYAKFKEYCKNNKNWQCIPIVMSYDNMENPVQYLVIIETESSRPYIGISFKYIAMEKIYITGIHIDKQSILEQHQIAMSHEHNRSCNCLDSWQDHTDITKLIIGDVNYHKHQSKRLKKELKQQKTEKNVVKNIITYYESNHQQQ